MIALATQHQATIIPGFTHSVQAQPTTFAHYLTAFIAALERDEARLRETYQRLNRSPLGAAAFTTSGFPLNRNRLAALLGFPATVENSYDAIIVSTVDSKAELASAFSLSALSLGRFAQQFVIQYSDSQPGWNLADEAVGHSSIMPQKRNPKPAEQLRILASTVIGDAQTVTLTAHNTPGGEVADFRIHLLQRTSQVAQTAASMYRALDSLVNAIRIDSTRTLSLVENDYSVMTELADTLHREAQLPFRQGHQFAAELASFGRAQRKVPAAISHADANIVYQRLFQKSFPLTEAQFRAALDPRHFVNSRRGDGGPQPASISSLLNNHRQRLDQLNSWLSAERSRLKAAEEVLEQVFRAI
jgi:argininosuccinate lyase